MLVLVLILQTNLHLSETMRVVLELHVSRTVMHLFLVFFQKLFVSLQSTLLYDFPKTRLGDFIFSFFQKIEDWREFWGLNKPLWDRIYRINMTLVVVNE
jgi:hypothetical protein